MKETRVAPNIYRTAPQRYFVELARGSRPHLVKHRSGPFATIEAAQRARASMLRALPSSHRVRPAWISARRTKLNGLRFDVTTSEGRRITSCACPILAGIAAALYEALGIRAQFSRPHQRPDCAGDACQRGRGTGGRFAIAA